jgi:hypothetical protein
MSDNRPLRRPALTKSLITSTRAYVRCKQVQTAS